MKEERSGPYLFPPLQLTKDPLKALMHVVKLGEKKQRKLLFSLPTQHNQPVKLSKLWKLANKSYMFYEVILIHTNIQMQ